MKLKLNISPCPNDTFMFYALVNGIIDTGNLKFDTSFADIEELNAMALAGEADVCKVSYAVVPELIDNYRILTSGSALGRGNGQLLVAREAVDTANNSLRIAIPGLHTTANLLMQRLFPALTDRTPILFSEIADRVATGEFNAGVLIHEGRFTYADKGLRLIADLGAEWERVTSLPLPLGAIVVSRKLPANVQTDINRLLRQSVVHAFKHPNNSAQFVRLHAQEMDEEVTSKHIALFVNDFSVDLGIEGCRAATTLMAINDQTIFVYD